MKTSNICIKIVTVLIFALISFLINPAYAVDENGIFNIEIVSNTSKEAELLLSYTNLQNLGEIDFEIGYSDGLKGLDFNEVESICTFSLEEKLLVKCDLSKYLSKETVNLGIIKYTWDSNLAQEISITTENINQIKNYTYFEIVPVERNSNIFSEMTVAQALKWLALIIVVALVIVVYILTTTYSESIRSQQYILFCMAIIIVWAISSFVIFSLNREESKTELTLGVSIKVEDLSEDAIIFNEKLVFDEESLIEDYGDFLSDYIIYNSSGLYDQKSDFNNDEIIDMLDFMEIYNKISKNSN